MRISVSVMAHTARLEQAVDLCNEFPMCSLSVDKGTFGEIRNGDQAWEMYRRDYDWHVVLQDDAIPVPDMLDQLEMAIESRPEEEFAISLYTGTGRPSQEHISVLVSEAMKQDASWIEWHSLLWGVGVAMPTRWIQPWLSWGRRNHSIKQYDRRLSRWLVRNNKPIFYTMPSLVDHADGETLLKTPWPKVERRAWWAGAREHWTDWTIRKDGFGYGSQQTER